MKVTLRFFRSVRKGVLCSILVVCFSLFFFNFTKAQDTLSVYFSTAEYVLSDLDEDWLVGILEDQDFSLLDSVYFIGLADSTGAFDLNEKLSRKRALEIETLCKPYISDNTVSKVFAKGESNNTATLDNKRVDVLFFFDFKAIEESVSYAATAEVLSNATDDRLIDGGRIEEEVKDTRFCYEIDYEFLRASNVKLTEVRGAKYVRIEASNKLMKKYKQLYYANSEEVDTFAVKEIDWKTERTGTSWWSKRRYVASIPESDFEAYRIFKKKAFPCGSCGKEPSERLDASTEKSKLQTDLFLMQNLQVKTVWGVRNELEVRVPREYVDVNSDYFFACNSKKKINWKIKKGDRQHYFTKISVSKRGLTNITKVSPVCRNRMSYSDCAAPVAKLKKYRDTDKSWLVLGKVCWGNKDSILVATGRLGVNKEWRLIQVGAMAGLDTQKSKLASANFRFFFFAFPLGKEMWKPRWRTPDRTSITQNFGRLYFSSEVRYYIPKWHGNYFQHDLFLGLSIENTKRKMIVPSAFVQGGLVTDTRDDSKLTYALEIGFFIRLWGI